MDANFSFAVICIHIRWMVPDKDLVKLISEPFISLIFYPYIQDLGHVWCRTGKFRICSRKTNWGFEEELGFEGVGG